MNPNQEEPKYRKFYVEWWNIRQRTVVVLVALLLSFGLIGYGGYRFIKSDFVNKPENPDAPKDAAIVITFEGDVRIIRAATRETILVTRQTFVSAGDTIQTQADGRAKIQMIDGSVLSIRPNSTVVIRDSTSLFGGPNVRVTLDDGQINVRTEDQPANSENVVEVRESENRIGADTDASFDINKESNSGEIRISRGAVETTVGGEKTIVRENEFAALTDGRIGTKEKLLGPPIHNSPSSDQQFVAGLSGAADATFRWQSPDVNLSLVYSIQLSKLPQFSSPEAIIVDKQGLPTPTLLVGGLLPGTYYWRVKAISSSGQASNWSAHWKFTVIKRENSKAIAVRDWNVESLGGTIYRVSAKTQPGATVRSQGKSTFALGDGGFLLQISAPGSQTVFEVSDDQGNRSSYILSLPGGTVIRQY